MRIRSALYFLGIILGGALLVAAGGFGEILLLTDQQCGGDGYLCQPQMAAAPVRHALAEGRPGSR